MKFYDPKYKQLDLGLLCSSLDELDKTKRDRRDYQREPLHVVLLRIA